MSFILGLGVATINIRIKFEVPISLDYEEMKGDTCSPKLLLRPRERLQSIVINTSVYVSVCLSVHEDITGTTRAIFTKFYTCCLWPWLGPLPLRQGGLARGKVCYVGVTIAKGKVQFWAKTCARFCFKKLVLLKCTYFPNVRHDLIPYY